MKHTVMMVAPYFPPHTGGLERYAKEISRFLASNHGWRVVVVTTREGEFSKEEIGGTTVYRLPYQFKISNTPLSLGWFRAIRAIIHTEQPDIVNVHTPVPGIGDIAAFVVRDIPLVVTYHAGSMKKGKWWIDPSIWLYERGPLRLLLHRANHLVCSSDAVRFGFLKSYVHKSSTIPPAVDHVLFHPRTTKDRPLRILFVAADLSHACTYKGLGMVIDALAEIRATGLDAQLDVVGDGDMRHEYEAQARALRISEAVCFHARLRGETLAAVYKNASVFALPTANDSYPVSILEAMSAGLPVVSTRVGDIPQMVEDGVTGFCVEPHRRDQLVEKLLLLLRDPSLCETMGAAARARILALFNWKERASRYDALFTELRTRKPVIAHVAAYYPPHVGGVEQRVRDLSRSLAKRGFETRVVTSNKGAHSVRSDDGVHVVSMRAFEFASTPITPGLIWQLLKLPRRSIIHLHVAHAFFPEVTALIAKMRRIPYIAHVRAIAIPSGRFGVFLPAYHRFVTHPVLRGARRIIVLTSDYKDIVHRQFNIPHERIVVIPNATTFSVVEKPRVVPHTKINLLAVGRISVQKNYALMLEAAHALEEAGVDFHLMIVGNGDGIYDLKVQATRLGIVNRVTFAGELFDEDLEAAYEAADLLVHTSVFETFGTVFIEAMAKGLPIVTTDVPGTRNVVVHERNGLLVPFSAHALSAAVIRLSTDASLYATISKQNLHDVRAYDWETITDRTIVVYEQARRI